jgi:hypothetical protein
VLCDVGRHRLQVGVDGRPAGLDQLGDVHEQLVHHGPQPLRRQLTGTRAPGTGHGADLLRRGVRAQPEQREQGGRSPVAGDPAELVQQGAHLPAPLRSDSRLPRRRGGRQYPVTPQPHLHLGAAQPGERTHLVQALHLVGGDPAMPLHQAADRRVEQLVARGVALLALRAHPRRGDPAAAGVEQLRAAFRVLLHEQPDEHAVLRVVALALPGGPDLPDALGDGGVVQVVDRRQVVELERIRRVRPAALLHGGEHALAVVVGVERRKISHGGGSSRAGRVPAPPRPATAWPRWWR